MKVLLQVCALALATATLARADGTEYAVAGMDTVRGGFRGQLTVTARPDRRFDVALHATFGSGAETTSRGTVGGGGMHIEGALDATPGLAGALGGAQAAAPPTFAATFELRTGACQGSITSTHASTVFWGSRPAAEPTGPTYEAQTPAQKQAAVWRELSAAPYGELPRIGSHGVGSNLWDTLQALRTSVLDRTFAQANDMRPPRVKIFHPFGSVAEVAYESVGAHPYTGFFASGGVGIARLSLATDEKTFIPGIALKLFVQGGASVNIHAIPSFDPQTSHDFFLRAPSNEIPPPSALAIKLFMKLASLVAEPLRRPVDHVAAVGPDGAAVAAPVAPRRIYFRPAEVHFPADTTRDFRDLLATIPPGTVIYGVYAETPTGELHIGDVRTRSAFVASEWGDRVLHFQHSR